MKEVDPLEALRAFVAKHPTQGSAAKALGVSEAFVSNMLRGMTPISQIVLSQLGLRRAVVRGKAS